MEVLQHQESQAERDRERELEQLQRNLERDRPPLWPVAVLVVITAWLWLLPPAFLRVDTPEPQPLEQEDASLRFVMYVQAQRIKAYRQETGRYPTRLEEAGPPLPAMRYTRLSEDLYQLTGETERLTLTYVSDLPLEDFVGPGADVIDESKL